MCQSIFDKFITLWTWMCCTQTASMDDSVNEIHYPSFESLIFTDRIPIEEYVEPFDDIAETSFCVDVHTDTKKDEDIQVTPPKSSSKSLSSNDETNDESQKEAKEVTSDDKRQEKKDETDDKTKEDTNDETKEKTKEEVNGETKEEKNDETKEEKSDGTKEETKDETKVDKNNDEKFEKYNIFEPTYVPRDTLETAGNVYCVPLQKQYLSDSTDDEESVDSRDSTPKNVSLSDEYFEIVERLTQVDEEIENTVAAIAANDTPVQVFLGGHVTGTTWRTEIAVPTLESMGITYFNPQVDEPTREYKKLEKLAKKNAIFLFYAINTEICTAESMIELAFMATIGRNIIVVILPHKDEENDVELDIEEQRSLGETKLLIRQIVEQNNVPMFSEIKPALDFIEYMLKGTKYEAE